MNVVLTDKLSVLQYAQYQRFATEEYVLQAGGVLCPQPGCGMGILAEPDCQRITCTNGCGVGALVLFVFCCMNVAVMIFLIRVYKMSTVKKTLKRLFACIISKITGCSSLCFDTGAYIANCCSDFIIMCTGLI